MTRNLPAIPMPDGVTSAADLREFRDSRYTYGGKIANFDPMAMAQDISDHYELTVHPETGEIWYHGGGLWRPDTEHPRLIDRHVRFMLNSIARASAVAETRAQLTATMLEALDPNQYPYHVNFENTVIDARTLQMMDHDPDMHLTTQVPHRYAPNKGGKHPQFDRFLATVFKGHEDSIPLVWAMMGYTLLPSLPIHQAFWLYGPTTRNGKGTLLRVIEAMLGKRNTSHVPVHSMSPTLDKFMAATMHNKLANIDNDASGNFIKDTSLFLQLSSGETPMVQHKNGQPFSLSPTATIIAASNTIPQVRDATPAWFGRWLPIYFPHSFYGQEDIHLAERLVQEVPAILVTAMWHLNQLLDEGRFVATPTVEAARVLFASRADSVRGWFNDKAQAFPTPPYAKLGALYASYSEWADRANNGHKLTQDQFRDRLSTIPGVEHKVYNGERGWTVSLSGNAPSDPHTLLTEYAHQGLTVRDLLLTPDE